MRAQRCRSSRTGPRPFSTMLVVLVAVSLLAGAVAGPAGAAKPQTGVWTLKAGQIVRFTGVSIFGCNTLAGGVVWDDASTVTFASLPGGDPCTDFPADTVLGPFSVAHSFRLFLQDVSCARTYYSDGTSTGGTSSNHVTIDKRGRVSFADAGFVGDSCPRADVDTSVPVGQGNFNASVTISRR
jgi:hypothetical protein